MNKEQLKEYLTTVSIFAPTQEQQDYVFEEFNKLDIKVIDIDKLEYYPSRIFISKDIKYNSFSNYICLADNTKLIYLSDFKKLIKELEVEVKDFEVNNDGFITKINNYNSDKEIYFIGDYEVVNVSIFNLMTVDLEKYIKLGFIATNKEVLEKKLRHIEIEQKIRNVADRLNGGKVIDWNNLSQNKYKIYFDFKNNKLFVIDNTECKNQGNIYCLSNKFLEECIKEIGEQDLIKYLKGE